MDAKVINVESSDMKNFLSRSCLTSCNIESKILRETPISRSQTPPIGEAWGGLNFYTIPFLDRKFFISELSTLMTLASMHFAEERYRVEIQPSPCLSYGWGLGAAYRSFT
jgi:hypothetical protein